MTGSARISPTAHYTGYVWYRHGLSDPALSTAAGRLLYRALAPVDRVSAAAGGPSVESMLIARHRMIDDLLAAAIESGAVRQAVEVAAGLSARGARFLDRYGERGLLYVEGDLPAMAARKRRLLARAGLARPRHRVVALDALAEGGPDSLSAVAAAHLDAGAGTAIITEGLLNYFDRDAVAGMWARFSGLLGRHPHGLYLSDTFFADELRGVRGLAAFNAALSLFSRGRVHIHFRAAADAHRALAGAGFDRRSVHRPEEFPALGIRSRRAGFVRVLEAWAR